MVDILCKATKTLFNWQLLWVKNFQNYHFWKTFYVMQKFKTLKINVVKKYFGKLCRGRLLCGLSGGVIRYGYCGVAFLLWREAGEVGDVWQLSAWRV
ncbi:MAG: hypothetical protein ACI306_08885 [Muribaculaceae bacterium]